MCSIGVTPSPIVWYWKPQDKTWYRRQNDFLQLIREEAWRPWQAEKCCIYLVWHSLKEAHQDGLHKMKLQGTAAKGFMQLCANSLGASRDLDQVL